MECWKRGFALFFFCFIHTMAAEGYYDFENFRYIYQYKDHLGNVRVSYVQNSAVAIEIRDTNDYYPFGMSFLKGSQATLYDPLAIPYNYKYNGKELQETGMYDYGARFYMPDIGRWGVVDPIADKYYAYSNYNYALNNPTNSIDPDGKLVIFVNGHWNKILNSFGMAPGEGLKGYWNYFSPAFIGSARDFFGDKKYEQNMFIDASSSYGGDQSGGDRYKLGQQYAKENWAEILAGLKDGEAIQVVSHSEGGAFAAGMADFLSNLMSCGSCDFKKHEIKTLFLSPDEADEFSIKGGYNSVEAYYNADTVSPKHHINGVKTEINLFGKSIGEAHGATVTKETLNKLKTILNNVINSNDFVATETENAIVYKRK